MLPSCCGCAATLDCLLRVLNSNSRIVASALLLLYGLEFLVLVYSVAACCVDASLFSFFIRIETFSFAYAYAPCQSAVASAVRCGALALALSFSRFWY
eukprot:scaffold8760_cov116-Isochrysis_galbana.AAC.8